MPLVQDVYPSRWESDAHDVGPSAHPVQLSYQFDQGVNVFFLATPTLVVS